MSFLTLVRGSGDLGSGVVLRLARCGIPVVITELPGPLMVRRLVSFAQAVYEPEGEITLEELTARRAADAAEARALLEQGIIPLLVDPAAEARYILEPAVIVDCRMTKQPPDLGIDAAPMMIGLGPGFIAGVNCRAVIETKRGHTLGRVIWQGPPEPDSGQPDGVSGHFDERVLRAPADGALRTIAAIGEYVEEGQVVAEVSGRPVRAVFSGYLRGLLRDGLFVERGLKIGDVDPRLDPRNARLISDKALAIGGGVLEAIFSRRDLRAAYCSNR